MNWLLQPSELVNCGWGEKKIKAVFKFVQNKAPYKPAVFVAFY